MLPVWHRKEDMTLRRFIHTHIYVYYTNIYVYIRVYSDIFYKQWIAFYTTAESTKNSALFSHFCLLKFTQQSERKPTILEYSRADKRIIDFGISQHIHRIDYVPIDSFTGMMYCTSTFRFTPSRMSFTVWWWICCCSCWCWWTSPLTFRLYKYARINNRWTFMCVCANGRCGVVCLWGDRSMGDYIYLPG